LFMTALMATPCCAALSLDRAETAGMFLHSPPGDFRSGDEMAATNDTITEHAEA
jgi:hypothetical protein